MLFLLTIVSYVSAYYICTDSITNIHYDADLPAHYPTHMISTRESCNSNCGPCTKQNDVFFGYTAWCSPSTFQILFHGLKKTKTKTYQLPLPTRNGMFEEKPRHPFIFHTHMCIYEEEEEPVIIYRKPYLSTKNKLLPTIMMQVPR